MCFLKKKKKGKRIGCSRESTYGKDGWKWFNCGTSPTVEEWPGKIKTAWDRVSEAADEQFSIFYTSSNCWVHTLIANLGARTSSQPTVVWRNTSTIMETFQFSRVHDTSTTSPPNGEFFFYGGKIQTTTTLSTIENWWAEQLICF